MPTGDPPGGPTGDPTGDATGDVPSVWTAREHVGERLAGAAGLVLALDFDGTLAPIVERPDDAAIDERVVDPLERLASAPTVAPAVVSGRQLSDLRERVDVDGVAYAGNHGLELAVDGRRRVPEPAREWRDAIDAVCDELADRLADVEGCVIENKELTATVHVRQVADERRNAVEATVREVVADVDPTLAVTGGKEIREVRPPIDWDKGRAVAELVEDRPPDWLAIYVGDDVTDEDAFAALSSMDRNTLAVVVGDRAETAADYRLDDQSVVPDFLSFVDENRPGDDGGNA